MLPPFCGKAILFTCQLSPTSKEVANSGCKYPGDQSLSFITSSFVTGHTFWERHTALPFSRQSQTAYNWISRTVGAQQWSTKEKVPKPGLKVADESIWQSLVHYGQHDLEPGPWQDIEFREGAEADEGGAAEAERGTAMKAGTFTGRKKHKNKNKKIKK